MSHTPGKLAYTESEHEPNRFSIGTIGGGWLLAIQHNGEQMAEAQRENVRRLVACWNACDGIYTEKLEKASGDISPVFALLMETSAQRDALLGLHRKHMELMMEIAQELKNPRLPLGATAEASVWMLALAAKESLDAIAKATENNSTPHNQNKG